MNRGELISIIVPVYNVERYLHRCVESICKQSYQNLEIILVDDGSTDSSGKMCDVLSQKDIRIKVIHKLNGGLGFARNSGFELVTGKYVTFIDSDDWISEEHIAYLYSSICRADADICFGGYTFVTQKGDTREVSVKLKKGTYTGTEIVEKIILPLIGAEPKQENDVQLESSCCMNLYRTEIIKKYNLRFISEKYAVAEDMYFNIDYLHYTEKVVVSEEIGYFYFENINSISRKYDKDRFKRTVNFYLEVENRVKKYKLTTLVGFRLHRSYIMKIRVAIRHIVMAELPLKEKLFCIKEILWHELTRKVLEEYPLKEYSFAQRLTTEMMKRKKTYIVYQMFKLREVMKSNVLFSKMLKKIGIGR